ncbi:MAG: hypothetical protein HYU76_14725 [Betaproteobacteria bacterium]|nr:hypothetical protein [Betaproteobacteria bacterium]
MALNSSIPKWLVVPVPAEATVSLPGFARGAVDQFPDRADPGFLARQHYQRHDVHPRDGRVVLHRVVREVRDDHGIDRERAARAHQQRVAVGRRLRHQVGADVAAASPPVVHHDGLPEDFAQRGPDDAGGDVHVAARRIRHDQADGAGGVLLRGGRAAKQRAED